MAHFQRMTDAPNTPRPFQQLALRFLEQTGRLRPLARKNNKSGYEGVSWNGQRNKWMAKITIGSKRRHVGLFGNPAEAARAIEQARAQPEIYFETRRLLRCRARRPSRGWQQWSSPHW